MVPVVEELIVPQVDKKQEVGAGEVIGGSSIYIPGVQIKLP